MKPAGRNVLIRPFTDEVVYAGVIHLPDTAKSRSCDGVVMAVGEWCDQVKPGDEVVYSRKQATDVMFEDAEHIIIDERAILLVIEEEINNE